MSFVGKFVGERVTEWRKATAKQRQRFSAASDISEDEVEKLLVEQGIISIGTPPKVERASAKEFRPIEVSGKSISEIIIEERG